MTATISAPSASREQSRRSASEWRALIRAFSRGDATRKQFYARHGVALSTFDWWRSQLRRELSQTAPGTTPSQSRALFVELAPEQLPLNAAASNWDVELELGRGVFLHLRRTAKYCWRAPSTVRRPRPPPEAPGIFLPAVTAQPPPPTHALCAGTLARSL